MLDKIVTALQLGLSSLFRVFLYKLTVRLGINPVKRITHNQVFGDFFHNSISRYTPEIIDDERWSGSVSFFHWKTFEISSCFPNWHRDYFSGSQFELPERSWWEIGDFEKGVDDIKLYWELSRFDWVIVLAKRARATGDAVHLDTLNKWLNNWLEINPYYRGPNWKCGQEASIRVMHLAMASIILEQYQCSNTILLSLVRGHLKRIWPTLMYAIGQNNNHGTSEAAALFIGGSWLFSIDGDKESDKWAKAGRRWLENRVRHLIFEDGTFSQYSLNYHRLVLDTLCMTEVWRKKAELPEFSSLFIQRARAATKWLYRMISSEDGDGPNLGANDGARLFPVLNLDYRDYRPSVQTATALFLNRNAYPHKKELNETCKLLDVAIPNAPLELPESFHFDNGGFALLRSDKARVLFRYPKFRYRPGQADVFHVDFWVGELNIFRDAGSYSYNAKLEEQLYFNGVEGHNTAQFDNHQPMPKLSRFLWGRWLSTKNGVVFEKSDNSQRVIAEYHDRFGCRHKRSIELRDNRLLVTDFLSHFSEIATLRWRLLPCEWVLTGNELKSPSHTIRISSDKPIEIKLTNGWESRYYYQKSVIPVLEIKVSAFSTITTEVVY